MNTILYTVHALDYDRGCKSQVHIYKMFIIHSSAKKVSRLVRASPFKQAN